MKELPIWGLLAEFRSPAELAVATRRAREAGYRRMDAYSPIGVEAVSDELGFRNTRVPLVCLLGGVFGGLGGFFLQYWINVLNFPLNIAGKPLNSWPAFIVVQSLHRDFLPSSWAMYYPTRWDIACFVGTLGMFAFGMLLFIRFLPMISIFEIRELLPEAHVQLTEAE